MAETIEAPVPIQTFVFAAPFLERVVDTLREEGAGQVESIVFFAGTLEQATATSRVTHLLVPKGPGVFKHAYHIRVSDRIIARLCNFVDPPHRVLLGQVHTHKEEAFHSLTDDANSLDTPGYLSIVIPRFAVAAPSAWRDWAFHECVAPGTFRLWAPAEVEQRISIESTGEVEVHDVQG
jgi:hypothetical protein